MKLTIKHAREIKVGVLAVIALFLLYFGFNYLKGVNIFSSTTSYYGIYDRINGLTEQAPVYIRGFKVGQVDRISYDFAREDAFTVSFSVNRDILLPQDTKLALVADGLLGGTALELQIPAETAGSLLQEGDTLATLIVPGLVENLQEGLLQDLGQTVKKLDSLVATVNGQLEGDHIKSALAKVDNITSDLNVSSAELKKVMKNDVPAVVGDAKAAVADIKVLADNIRDVDIQATVARVDKAVDQVGEVVAAVNSTDGTLGLLINDKTLYKSVNATVNSADSLLVDLKANPKRYVHFSLFGQKEKKDKK
ncbi:MAG: MCE family protein [Paludibacteraceae bacterium]|nr:MCE family protein [Paludibacteraceae bacterium]